MSLTHLVSSELFFHGNALIGSHEFIYLVLGFILIDIFNMTKINKWFKPKFKPELIPDYLNHKLLKRKPNKNTNSITFHDIIDFLNEESRKLLDYLKRDDISDKEKVSVLKHYLKLFVDTRLYGNKNKQASMPQMFEIPNLVFVFSLFIFIVAVFTSVFIIFPNFANTIAFNVLAIVFTAFAVGILAKSIYFIIAGLYALRINYNVVVNLFINPIKMAFNNANNTQAKIDVILYTTASILAVVTDKSMDEIIPVLTKIPGYKKDYKQFLAGLFLISRDIYYTFRDERIEYLVIFLINLVLIGLLWDGLLFISITAFVYVLTAKLNREFKEINYNFTGGSYYLSLLLLKQLKIPNDYIKEYKDKYSDKLTKILQECDS